MQLFENAPESRARECVLFGRAPTTEKRKEVFASAEGASGENLGDLLQILYETTERVWGTLDQKKKTFERFKVVCSDLEKCDSGDGLVWKYSVIYFKNPLWVVT